MPHSWSILVGMGRTRHVWLVRAAQRLKSAAERLQRELEEHYWSPDDECWSPGTPLEDLRKLQVRLSPSHTACTCPVASPLCCTASLRPASWLPS